MIHHEKNFSNYNFDYDFELLYDGEPNDSNSEYILKNCRFYTESKVINKLYDEGKIKVLLIVECPDTIYRKTFELGKEGKDIQLNANDLNEKFEISMFAYATQDFVIKSDEFQDDYKDREFEIDKYVIIGANNGYTHILNHYEMGQSVASSIFSIQQSNNDNDSSFLIECDQNSRKIIITFPKNSYENYKAIYRDPDYKETFFCMILVPALIKGLLECKKSINNDQNDLDEISNIYPWFKSIEKSYEKLKGKKLTNEDFIEMNEEILAQELLGNPLKLSLENLLSSRKDNLQNDELTNE
ncbi:hypothetical protein [Mycoplasmopsis adleri]|uniref:hypothetical protein n=1 Tax=Mycoplasmopsis adleri TaxID=51362 RepID=UPI003873925D